MCIACIGELGEIAVLRINITANLKEKKQRKIFAHAPIKLFQFLKG